MSILSFYPFFYKFDNFNFIIPKKKNSQKAPISCEIVNSPKHNRDNFRLNEIIPEPENVDLNFSFRFPTNFTFLIK